jgi:hypothetical protein
MSGYGVWVVKDHMPEKWQMALVESKAECGRINPKTNGLSTELKEGGWKKKE